MVVVEDLVKRFGSTLAVDHLSFTVTPGRVTGFLGPNGSGKSTTMRCMLGLDRPDSGRTRFADRHYRALDRPLTSVGSLLDAGYVHPGRTGRDHLRWMAASNGIPRGRVDEVLALVGLAEVARRRVRGYSLGMRQRLGLAGVLLGDPHTVLLDEPANGLDPEGIRWIRDVLVHLAGEGRTVLVSSHLLSEMALMAHDLVVVGRGRLVEQCSVGDFISRHTNRWVHVRSPELSTLADHLHRIGAKLRFTELPGEGPGADVFGITAEAVGEAAAANGIVLHELAVRSESLEDAFLAATATEQEFRAIRDEGMGFPQPQAAGS
ncbi:MAG: ATP-binding cassette domain-containing protein [Ilumatobacteraceae bacterium]